MSPFKSVLTYRINNVLYDQDNFLVSIISILPVGTDFSESL